MTIKQLDGIEALFINCDDTFKDILNEDNWILFTRFTVVKSGTFQ